jgi:hypothetical protein
MLPVFGWPGEGRGAEKILASSIEALGGKAALEWKTRSDSGHLTAFWPGWGELQANVTQLMAKPGKLKLDQDFSAYDHPFFFTYYCNDGEVWAMINLGVRQGPRFTDRMTRWMRTVDAVGYCSAKCDTFFVVSEVEDDSLFAAGAIERIGVVDRGDTLFVDFNRKTHLPVRWIEENGSTHVVFADYRETNGPRTPFQVTVYEDGSKSAEYVWEEVKFGEPIDDAIFEEYRPKVADSVAP